MATQSEEQKRAEIWLEAAEKPLQKKEKIEKQPHDGTILLFHLLLFYGEPPLEGGCKSVQ